MDRQEFVDALHQKLLDAHFPDEYASQQSSVLMNRLLELPDSTAESYTTERNLDILVKKLISQDGDRRILPDAQPSDETSAPAEEDISANQSQTASGHREMPVISDSDVEIVATPTTKRAAKTARNAQNPAEQYVTCDHPKLLTALLGILCTPTIILLLGVSFGIFAGLFILLAAAILLIAVGIIVIVGGGSIVSLVALLYGATQLLSTAKYIGLHEVGFGLLVAGVTMAASILLYNVAVRLIPYLFQKIAQLTRLFAKKLTGIAKNAVKGCEQL